MERSNPKIIHENKNRVAIFLLFLVDKTNNSMTTKSHISRRVTAVLAMFFLLPALILFMKWSSIGLSVSGISKQEQLKMYLGFFPAWLQNMSTIHAISIVCCVMAIILAARSYSKDLLSVRVLMLLTVVVAFFILLFDIYQMV